MNTPSKKASLRWLAHGKRQQAASGATSSTVCNATPRSVRVVPITNIRYWGRGEFNWVCLFRIDQPAGRRGGYVVQELTQLVYANRQEIHRDHFWEVFEMPSGATITPEATNRDLFQFNELTDVDVGRVRMLGRCWYFDLTYADLVSVGFHPRHLYYRGAPPCFWRVGGARHEIDYRWDERPDGHGTRITSVPSSNQVREAPNAAGTSP